MMCGAGYLVVVPDDTHFARRPPRRAPLRRAPPPGVGHREAAALAAIAAVAAGADAVAARRGRLAPAMRQLRAKPPAALRAPEDDVDYWADEVRARSS